MKQLKVLEFPVFSVPVASNWIPTRDEYIALHRTDQVKT